MWKSALVAGALARGDHVDRDPLRRPHVVVVDPGRHHRDSTSPAPDRGRVDLLDLETPRSGPRAGPGGSPARASGRYLADRGQGRQRMRRRHRSSPFVCVVDALSPTAMTALTIVSYPVHRQRLPASPIRTSSSVSGPECASQQGCRGDQHSGGAEAALDATVFEERTLELAQLAGWREALDSRDLTTVGLQSKVRAGVHRLRRRGASCRRRTRSRRIPPWRP